MLIFGIVLSVSFEKMSQNGDYSLEKVYICSKNSFEKMLRRKIEGTLAKWKNTSGHKPLVIMGIRQCGKTFIAQHFAEEHYKTVVYINFIKQPERISAFSGSKDVDTILLNLWLKNSLENE